MKKVAHPMSPPPLDLRQVSFVRDGRTILDRVDLRVEEGQRWVLLGPNGSGKTSLLRIASTYELPSSGTAWVLGGRLGRTDVWRLRRRIGYASAALSRLLRPELTVREAVAVAGKAQLAVGRIPPDAEAWARADALVADAGLGQRASTPLRHLSEGERQRVQLARTLMPDADLVLLDEPTAGLDMGGRERLVRQLARLPAGRTAVLVTHHLEEIPPGTTHAGLLVAGRITAAGPVADVLTADALEEAFGVRLELARRDDRWFAWGAA